MIQAILFDIGGTLRYTKRIPGRDPEIIDELMAFIGVKSSRQDFIHLLTDRDNHYKRWYETTLIDLPEPELWTRFMLPDFPAEFVQQNAMKLHQLWRASRGTEVLREDAVSTIRELDQRGYKIGIISNINSSVEAHQFLKDNHLEDCVSTVVLSIVFGRKKPHPAIFYAAAREIQVPIQNCAYIGNNIRKDVIGSREAGIGKVIILKTEKSKQELSGSPLQPDHIIDGLREILDIFPPLEKQMAVGLQDESPVLYDVALSTMWHVRQSIPFQETFGVARSLGFARFELNHQIPPERFDQIDFRQFRIGSLHDPCPAVVSMDEQKQRDWMVSSLDEECRQQGVNIVRRTIDEAVKLHARLVVIHPGSIVADSRLDRELRKKFRAGEVNETGFTELREELIADRKKLAGAHMDSVLRSMKEIIEYARPTGISIGLENRYRYYDIPILEELGLLLELTSEEWYGFQYDIGHAQTLDRLGLCNHEEWLIRYANRMVGVHIHDVKGILDHQKPGSGEVDFEMIARYLSPQVNRTLEVSPDLSTEDISAALETLGRAGCIHRL